uniref:Uncharacterized protein n=1 Tax=Timema monikensis TaxID=170555 RepID=A0A7R9E9V7_9NEOP|nr:unnamed protein product [Timema monikensis]
MALKVKRRTRLTLYTAANGQRVETPVTEVHQPLMTCLLRALPLRPKPHLGAPPRDSGQTTSDNGFLSHCCFTSSVLFFLLLAVPVCSSPVLTDKIIQFEQYARATFHIGPSPHSLRFVTDGQLPLRQCLHPEACTKNLELPTYYAVFNDLRKEFKVFYAATEEINSIGDMVTCILLSSIAHFVATGSEPSNSTTLR